MGKIFLFCYVVVFLVLVLVCLYGVNRKTIRSNREVAKNPLKILFVV